jgi:soluble lytic murein transglycosylase-like protein
MESEASNSLNLLRAQAALGTLGAMQDKADGLTAKGKGAQFSEDAKKRWKASLDFEAMFLGQMYKAMRQSVSGTSSELTQASPGREIFTEMLDQQYANQRIDSPVESGQTGMDNALKGTSNSLAAQIYRSLTRQNQDIVPEMDLRKSSALLGRPPLEARDGNEDIFSSEGLALGKILEARGRKAYRGTEGATLAESMLAPLVDLAAGTHKVSGNLIKSVIKAESNNKPQAVSRAGAKGLMQIMDSTAADLGLRDVFNPRENILAGTRYLKQLLDRYQGDEKLALAAYNAGPAQVDKYKGVPPFEETRNYVEKVLKTKRELDAKSGLVGGHGG